MSPLKTIMFNGCLLLLLAVSINSQETYSSTQKKDLNLEQTSSLPDLIKKMENHRDWLINKMN